MWEDVYSLTIVQSTLNWHSFRLPATIARLAMKPATQPEHGSAPAPARFLRGRGGGRRDDRLGRLGVLAVGVGVALALAVTHGLHALAQASVFGLVSGTYLALGAVGLSLIYGVLRLINFAHGDMLTFGAYVALLFSATLGAPVALAIAVGAAATAALGLAFEVAVWRPLRKRRTGLLELLLMAIGAGFVLRSTIQLVAGGEARSLGVDTTRSVSFLTVEIGRVQLVVVLCGLALLAAVAYLLTATTLGRHMRAVADNPALAEASGVDTARVTLWTWVVGGALAGTAGGFVAASTGALDPNLGVGLLLSLFAAVVLGGIGSAYGALAGGLVIGIGQEWSTIVVDARWKSTIGFAVLVATLLLRPQGLLGRSSRL
jgi:neutral amino acid transport system permease protein